MYPCHVCESRCTHDGREEHYYWTDQCPVCGWSWEHSYGEDHQTIGEKEFVWKWGDDHLDAERRRIRRNDAITVHRESIGLDTAEFHGFAQQVLDNPNDYALRAVFADWLEERGAVWLAQWHRSMIPQGALDKT